MKILSCLAACLLCPLVLHAQVNSRAPMHVQLPYLHENFTVLFQGDSITDGGRQRTGTDQNHIMGQDYAYVLAAEIGSRIPERNIHFINRGVSGERVVDLAARWKDDTLALKPDVLSILVGVNDTFGSKGILTVEEFEAAYDKLLAQTVAALPDTKIVLGEPFLLPVGKHQQNYEQEMNELKKRQAVVAKLGDKYHLPVIHYQQAFDDAQSRAPADRWSWDGIHPTYAGHGLMAREWMRVTSAAWGNG
jgi:lysophospholipase L1-like esterase